MQLSFSKNFLFVHISKTAGASVATMLKPYTSRPAKTQYRRLLSHLPVREDPHKARLPMHCTAALAKRKLGDEFFSGLYKFAFVRNPYDWMVSRYEFIRQSDHHHRHHRVRDLDFPKFVQWQCNGLLGRRRDQCHFLLSRSGELLVDDIFRFETLEQDIAILCEKLGIDGPEDMPHRHRTVRKPYQEYYTKAERDAVARAFVRDIERFGYSFDAG